MSEQIIIDIISNKVRIAMQAVEPGHDFSHITRVLYNALEIQKIIGGDCLIVALSALLHEMGDDKFFIVTESLQNAKSWLLESGVDSDKCNAIIDIVSHIGFSKQLDNSCFKSIEFDIVHDADMLEAIGAIGIARTFSYGGSKGRLFFDEDIYPVTHLNSESYKKVQSASINHFFEKLLLLHQLIRTSHGKVLAKERHQFMWHYLYAFLTDYPFISSENRTKWFELLKEHHLE